MGPGRKSFWNTSSWASTEEVIIIDIIKYLANKFQPPKHYLELQKSEFTLCDDKQSFCTSQTHL